MPELPGPEYHYYRAPYSILSFVAGLYCDKHWSDEEFKKWESSESREGEYTYYKYLDPYQPMPSVSAEVISEEVAEDKKNEPDAAGRRAPNRDNCLKVWPELVAELCQPPGQPSGGRLPLFYERKPILSTLAAIYLGDGVSLKQALAFWDRVKQPALKAQLMSLAQVKGTADAAPVLASLQEAVLKDLIEPPNCW